MRSAASASIASVTMVALSWSTRAAGSSPGVTMRSCYRRIFLVVWAVRLDHCGRGRTGARISLVWVNAEAVVSALASLDITRVARVASLQTRIRPSKDCRHPRKPCNQRASYKGEAGRPHNPWVVGSSPTRPTNPGARPEPAGSIESVVIRWVGDASVRRLSWLQMLC